MGTLQGSGGGGLCHCELFGLAALPSMVTQDAFMQSQDKGLAGGLAALALWYPVTWGGGGTTRSLEVCFGRGNSGE